VAESQARCLIVTSPPSHSPAGLPWVLVDAWSGVVSKEGSKVAEDVGAMPPLRFAPEVLYLMFTSGTTGRMKGVLGTEQGALNRVRWAQGMFPPSGAELMVRRTPLIFVDAVAEVFAALLQGIP
jgi:acyl-coenzyme A synthetase/AMP-(fatty) acid ligase